MSLPRHRRLLQSLISQRHYFQLPCPWSRKFHVSSANHSEWPKEPNPTPYEILGLPPTASSTEIKKRYYQLAQKYHPDSRFRSGEAEQERLQRFRQVVQANELISAARTRRM